MHAYNNYALDFPGSPVVKSPPCNGGDTGSIPGQGIKIPTAAEQPSLRATTRESVHRNQIPRCSQRK